MRCPLSVSVVSFDMLAKRGFTEEMPGRNKFDSSVVQVCQPGHHLVQPLRRHPIAMAFAHRSSQTSGVPKLNAQTELQKNALGVFHSTVMGIAGTAPAFTVAVSTAAILAAVGVQAMGSLLYCGLIMLGIMFAFVNLNRTIPDAGAAFAWVGKIFGPSWGFMCGWALLVASLVFMVSATVPAATATLLIVAPHLAESTLWCSIVAALWLAVVTAIVLRGILHAAVFQVILLGTETIIVLVLIFAGLGKFWNHPIHVPSWDWISPFAFTPETFVSGALVAVFFYWGWDVTLNLGEESEEGAEPASGRGAVLAMANTMATFLILTLVILISLTDSEVSAASSNVLYTLADKLLPHPLSYIAVMSTMLSTVGAIETQIIQFSRSLFAMSRAGMMHARYAQVNPQWHTPVAATLVIWGIGTVMIFASSFSSSVSRILTDSVSAIGLDICFYMGITGIACAWHFRSKMSSGFGTALTHVLWPGFAGVFLLVVGFYSFKTLQLSALVIGIGGLALGLLPLYTHRRAERRALVAGH